MRFRFILLLTFLFGFCSVSHSTQEIIDSDQIDRYLRVAFSSMNFLACHKDLVEEGFFWEDVNFCNEMESEDEASHTVEMGLRYYKGQGKKWSEYANLSMRVTYNSRNGKKEVTKIKVKRGIFDSDKSHISKMGIKK